MATGKDSLPQGSGAAERATNWPVMGSLTLPHSLFCKLSKALLASAKLVAPAIWERSNVSSAFFSSTVSRGGPRNWYLSLLSALFQVYEARCFLHLSDDSAAGGSAAGDVKLCRSDCDGAARVSEDSGAGDVKLSCSECDGAARASEDSAAGNINLSRSDCENAARVSEDSAAGVGTLSCSDLRLQLSSCSSPGRVSSDE